MATSLLNALINGAKDLAAEAARGDLTTKAKDTWNSQSTLTKGAVAGGLLGVLLSGDARRMLGTGVKVGGAALIGGLAYKAYQDWQNGKSPDQAQLPAPSPSDDFSINLLQAMIAATKADGQVTAAERAQITAQLPQLGLGPDAAAMIAAELDAPFDPNRIAALAQTEAEASQIYAASLLAVDPEGMAEKGYLAMLAARLNLDAGLVQHLHANANALKTA
jgi:uncharacterized membrane protein YebE (DUF533 family)